MRTLPSSHTWPAAAAGPPVGVSGGSQVGVPGAEDELLLAGPPGAGVGVLLADVALDGAELEGGQGAATDHAEHPVPCRVELHQVLGPPALVVIPPVVPTRDAAATRP